MTPRRPARSDLTGDDAKLPDKGGEPTDPTAGAAPLPPCSLSRPQRFHRIDVRGAPCWEIASNHTNDGHGHRNDDEGRHIDRANAEE
jgi:hypothetical protein